MKKILTLIVTVLMSAVCMFSLTACGSSETIKIGVQAGTTGSIYSSYIKGTETKEYSAPGLAVDDMLLGRVDYVIVDKATANALVQDKDGVKMIDIALTSEQYAIGVDVAQTDLLTAINGVLASKQTEINAIIEKYNNGDTDSFVGVESATFNAGNAAGQLVVATNAEFDPWEYYSDQLYWGIDMEIAKLIATELNLELVIQNMAFEAVVGSVGSNNVDIAIAAITVTAERKQTVNFSNGYYTESQVVLCKESDTSLDAAGTVVDVLRVLGAKK